MAQPSSPPSPDSAAPFNPWAAAYEYGVDAWQRAVLYADVMRQRGNQYHAHMAQRSPNVLSMAYETVMDGRTFERPVNYGLLRITPPDDVPANPIKRPFLVVDPRAGHGPGIGGFKPESEIGVALRAGHPCYFATFLPMPEPTQTVEDVMRAEARFLEEIIGLHPEAEGKPVVVGNCQAGWQIMMTAAMRPELFGPIIIAGAPLSYWAGWRHMNPMRYSGGLLGGSWLTAMASDLGAGKFDGAALVQNFENLNPANTLWSKQYGLYANVDTEAARYLSFEKWWGGHVYLNAPEIQYIVDNLFIGNRLATAGLVTSDGIRIDLRNIRSPIIVFCSKGDNITPPPQALGWIPDLYENDQQIQAHGQTIVYAVHESIGHLGIFVSGAVARKEHHEFTGNIDMVDVLPPGIYQAEIVDKTPDTPHGELAEGNYLLSFVRRRLDDVRAIVAQEPEDDRRFAAVSRISQMNLGLYKSFVQPMVQAAVTPQSAELRQRMHPLRLPYEMLSDLNPAVAPIEHVADQVRAHRQAASPDNPFMIAQEAISRSIENGLNAYQSWRDATYENIFMAIYGSPQVQALAGLGSQDVPPRPHPGISPEHQRFMRARADELGRLVEVGGVREAAVRMLLYVSRAIGEVDARSFAVIRKFRADKDHMLSLQEFKDVVRDQALILMRDVSAAVRAIPILLQEADASEIRTALADMRQVLSVAEPLPEQALACLAEMDELFEHAAKRAERRAVSSKVATSKVASSKATDPKGAAPKGASSKAVSKVPSSKPAAAVPRAPARSVSSSGALTARKTSKAGVSRPDAQLVLDTLGSPHGAETARGSASRTRPASASDESAVAPIKRAVAARRHQNAGADITPVAPVAKTKAKTKAAPTSRAKRNTRGG